MEETDSDFSFVSYYILLETARFTFIWGRNIIVIFKLGKVVFVKINIDEISLLCQEWEKHGNNTLIADSLN